MRERGEQSERDKRQDQKSRDWSKSGRLIAGRFKTLGEYRAWQRAQVRNKRSRFADLSKGDARGRRVGIAELGEGFPDLANRFGVDAQDLANANPDTSKVSAGAAYNLPPKFSAPDYETAEDDPQGAWYPEYWNPGSFSEFKSELGSKDFDVQGAYGARYWNPSFEGVEKIGDLTDANKEYWEKVQGQTRLSDYGTAWATRNISEDNTYSRKWEKGDMFQIPGLPMEAMWDAETGERKPPEEVFDALYLYNEIDPSDPEDVEWFWSFADNDLITMGEFFDVIEWPPEYGYGGGYEDYEYPSYAPSSAPGQKPQRGDYTSYLSLTSWSI